MKNRLCVPFVGVRVGPALAGVLVVKLEAPVRLLLWPSSSSRPVRQCTAVVQCRQWMAVAGSSQAGQLWAQSLVSRVLMYLLVSHAVEAAVALRHVVRAAKRARAEPSEDGRTTLVWNALTCGSKMGPL